MRSELFINNTVVELKSAFGCLITYAISDIRKPETRNGSYSKTITLPGTKIINQLLTHIYDVNCDVQTSGTVNFAPDFNPNLKASVRLYTDGFLQFTGYMKLLDIVRSQADLQRMDYQVAIIGEVATIYNEIGDKKLSDLDLSAYNHTYNKATQKATWTDVNYGTGYVYPMINYGGVVSNSWDVENFYPAVYLKTLIDEIFSDAGFTYDSSFFNSAFFKRLVVPYAGEKFTITSTQATQRLFSAQLSANLDDAIVVSSTSTSTATVFDPPVFDSEISDTLNQYNPLTGVFTAAQAGVYEFLSSGTVAAVATTNVFLAPGASYQYDIQMRVNGVLVSIGMSPLTPVAPSTSAGNNIIQQSFVATSQSQYLNPGDTVQMYVRQRFTHATGSSGTVTFRLGSGAVFYNRITQTAISDGNPLDMASWLPVDIRQADFLTSVFRTFNLYVEPDRTQPNRLKIETEPDFYESGTTRDWSQKLDVSKPFTIIPMGALDAIRYKIKYADDTDYWNKFYKDKFKETYGERNVDIVNDFLKNTNTNEVIFAATPLIGTTAHDRIIPEIFTLTNSGVQQPIRGKLRLLYWAGTFPTNNTWTYTSSVSGNTTESFYPYAGHVDNPYLPTVDLSFGVPREIYYVNPYGTTIYTNNNLYNQYHAQYITEITDRNSKLVTGYFRLTPRDIFDLSFRDIIRVDTQNYRLHKVIDYDPASYGVTKVELLKIRFAPPVNALWKTLTFTYGEAFDGTREPAPGYGGNVGVGDLSSSSSNVVTGRRNYISTTAVGVTVSGSNNRIGSDCQNISVFNSSGVAVGSGLQNVSVIGTNDIVISESNVSYLNGVKISSESTWSTLSSTQTVESTGKYLVSGTITLTLQPSTLREGDRYVFKKTDDATFTITISGGGVNIDGAASKTLTTQFESIVIEYNGTQFYIVG